MARVVDHVLALLPFEPPYMQAAGMTCDFVGHPVAAEPQADPEEVAALRAELAIGPGQPVLALLPGSRRGEVTPARAGLRRGGAPVARARPGTRGDRAGGAPVVGAARRADAPDDAGLAARPRSARLPGAGLGGAQARGLRRRPTWRSPPRAPSASSWPRQARRW